MLVDPVCGKRIRRERAHIAIDYQHITYYLCCPNCQADFERAPELFARPQWGERTRRMAPRAKVDRPSANVTPGTLVIHGPRGG